MIRTNQKKIRFTPIIGIIVVLSIIIFIILGIRDASKSIQSNAKKQLENAVRQTAIHCYAIEGIYPPNVEYMEKNYGLHYNHDEFFVDYQVFASNILPDIFVVSHLDKEVDGK